MRTSSGRSSTCDQSDSANRVIIASRAALPDTTKLEFAAKALVDPLKPYGVPIEQYASTMNTSADWDATARILTDQYSPANLLEGAAVAALLRRLGFNASASNDP